uniref:Uncharacterized protein n=1 Tax=Kwoniella bestiolae CBS 10118 TaxID=1296100 RepID=A0A1B9G0W7_9TREE|nr:hypothetical protein I302_06128 [Kwoniella bestiolae CBS 10118]OCF24667.1 hypothetical protein I302_06128 [Kwoniella bestiolae CBS 10118]
MSPPSSPPIPLVPINTSSQDTPNSNPTRQVVSSHSSTHSSRSSILPIPGAFSPTPRAATPIPPQRPLSQHSSSTNSSFHTPPPLVSSQPTATPPMANLLD